jgi:hypothetical protein
MALFALAAFATSAEMYFSSDKNGANRVTNVQEGDQVWICVYDPDENIDCDVRDKIWTDIKVMDPKTGAYINWESYGPASAPALGYSGKDGDTTQGNYLEETGPDTGLFVSNVSFQIGTREDYNVEQKNTHVVGLSDTNSAGISDFKWGGYMYTEVTASTTQVTASTTQAKRGYFLADGSFNPLTANAVPADTPSWPSEIYSGTTAADYLVGRFENMDTLVGMYKDQNDDTDVAVTQAKIIDTKSTISWDQEVYKDANGSATITVVDPDENLNCNKVEYVPVFIIVDPGSWNPVQTNSATNFCMLKRYGGVDSTGAPLVDSTGAPLGGTTAGASTYQIRWFNIYNSPSTVTSLAGSSQPVIAGTYFIQYPTSGNVNTFDTASDSGVTRVMFYAQETGPATGVFQLNLNSILKDLGFNSLKVHDVLVAYYLDPNDFDDFSLAPAYIEEHQHSVTSFTDATRAEKSEYWIGRDPVYVQVIDANANVDSCCPEQVVVHVCDVHGEDDSEWLVADETSSNSPVFFTNAGTELLPVWDALGNGFVGKGGYQLKLDNWKIEAYNEDQIYARYNDVYYTDDAMAGIGDSNTGTHFPPEIRDTRVANDVSFAMMSIADTQVYDGTTANMYFLDRQGNRVSGYVNSDCVFVEVVDPDQDEDQYRRERVAGYWDGGQNFPFGPEEDPSGSHAVNDLLGLDNIFSTTSTNAKLYVLNPRNGKWAAIDLLETGVATGDFVSVTCIDLTSQYTGVPTLGVKPGDTVLAIYQDPSNHSDSAWISIKVGIGGGGTPPGQGSTTIFVDSEGNEVDTYTDVDDVYVKVVDPSHAGAASLLDAVEIDGTTYDLAPLAGAQTDTFITDAIDLDLVAGSSITATYTDPTDPTDTSSDTISIIASELSVIDFYAGPNPFATETVFTYHGTGIATEFSVTIYDLSGHMVWTETLANVTGITWNGTNEAGAALANGAYIYLVMATDGTNTFTDKGTVFINK